jgi:hypothetical protein
MQFSALIVSLVDILLDFAGLKGHLFPLLLLLLLLGDDIFKLAKDIRSCYVMIYFQNNKNIFKDKCVCGHMCLCMCICVHRHKHTQRFALF